jgi:hypothetical protein
MHFQPFLSLLPLTLAIPNASPAPQIIDLSTASIPTVREAAAQARNLLQHETIATLSTIFPSGEPHGLEHQPIGLVDYYADCSSDGSPSLLAMNIATSFRNLNADKNSSISLSVRQHTPHSRFSPAAHPRLSLIGRVKEVGAESDEAERVKRCFLRRHPDATLWTPGNKVHDSYWVRFEVENIYWIGGFGNVAYIGWIPKELYQAARTPRGGMGVIEQVKDQSEEKQSAGRRGELKKFFFQG